MPPIDQNRVRQIGFLIIVVLLGLLLFRELASFLPALLGAITLYILLRRWMYYLSHKKNWNRSLAATLLMLGSLIILLLPIGVIVNMMASKVSYVYEHSDELINATKKVVNDVENQLNLSLVSDENINKIGNVLASWAPKILGATFNTLAIIVFMYFILYFMLANAREMEETLYEYTPLKDENVHKLGEEIHKSVLTNAVGIPVIAILQGVVALIGYLIIGVKEPFFWFVVTCIVSMFPVVGAALAYVPLAIIFFANNDTGRGIAMLIFGFAIIGSVDNLFRFMLVKKIGNVHPMITVFGVIIGLQLFGFIGLIFGPLLISLFILLLKIYSNEFIVKQREMKDPRKLPEQTGFIK